MVRKHLKKMGMAAFLLTTVCFMSAGSIEAKKPETKKAKAAWLSGDFHQHTYYTDGATTFDFVMGQNYLYGLDWWANSEHGGERNRNGEGLYWDDLEIPILGSYELSDSHQEMWRWQSLRDYVFSDILTNRGMYPDRRIFSGLEWYVPGHEHCSVAVVDDDATAISAFAYLFDASLEDFTSDIESDPRMAKYGELSEFTKRNGHEKWVQNATSVGYDSKAPADQHADAVAATAWMQDQYDAGVIDNSWIIFAHIERNGPWATGGYDVEHFRDFNNAAPDICFGFEGAPGHQVNSDRGFGNEVTCTTSNDCASEDFGGTYGVVGYYSAKVGGLWDAMLGEGRRWFNFANSDYHRHYTAGGDDFYPGEYQKTWVYAVDADSDGEFSLNEIADGLRSGNSFFAHGDLINFLEFKIQNKNQEANMGDELVSDGKVQSLNFEIKFRSPETNNCLPDGEYITSCAAPVVDHIDLIAGEITGKIDPSGSDYNYAANDTTRVIATFTSADWKADKDGYNVIAFHLKDVDGNMYFRLRGTNVPPGTRYETDAAGNPLPDALVTQNLGIDGAQEAWNDLWFYSNPIFVYQNNR
jgi:hypothetical protein